MKSILVVDDEIAFNEQLMELLILEGYQAVSASSVQEALVLLRKTTFDLILVDFMMPLENGLVLIKQIDRSSGTQVVLMSASPAPEMGTSKKTWDVFLRKPFDLEDLLTMVKSYSEAV